MHDAAKRYLKFSYISLYILVESAARIEEKCGKRELGFGEVMGEATSIGPKCFQKCVGGEFVQQKFTWHDSLLEKLQHIDLSYFKILHTGSRKFVNALILLMQFGCCCVYVVFIADNLKVVFNEEFDLQWSNKMYICMCAPIFMLLSIVRKINLLATFSGKIEHIGNVCHEIVNEEGRLDGQCPLTRNCLFTRFALFLVFGNLVFLAGFVIILQYVAHDYIPLKELPWVEKPTSWARGFATAAFAFEGKIVCIELVKD